MVLTDHTRMLIAGLEGHGDAACIVAPAGTGLKGSPGGQRLLACKHSAVADSDIDQDDHRQVDQARAQAVLPRSNSPSASPNSATTTSLAATNAAALDQVRRATTCGLCSDLVSASLVLSCGHQFCGACLFDHLNQKPSCPTCQVGLRAIPVRCLALDSVVEAFGRVLSKSELDAYHVRAEEGKSAANKINKMFWWLQPAAIPALGDPQAQHHNVCGSHPQHGHNAAAAAATMAMTGAAAVSRVRSSSSGGAAAPGPRQAGQQRVTLDAHIAACTPPMSAHNQVHHAPVHHQHQNHPGQPMLPGLFEAIGAQQPQQPICEDGGFDSRRNVGSKAYHRDPQRMPFYNNHGHATRPPVHRNFNGAVPGGIDASHLVAMGLNPPLASRPMPAQQQHQHQLPQFFDYSAASAQMSLPPVHASAMQQFMANIPDYAGLTGAAMQPQSQGDSLANLQLQQLINSLTMAEVYPQQF